MWETCVKFAPVPGSSNRLRDNARRLILPILFSIKRLMASNFTLPDEYRNHAVSARTFLPIVPPYLQRPKHRPLRDRWSFPSNGKILAYHIPIRNLPMFGMCGRPIQPLLIIIGGYLITFSETRPYATRSPGSSPLKKASRLSRARNPMASRVSVVALPMWGIRKVFFKSRYLG